MGFRCPKCGAGTRVSETRVIEQGVRRRRFCLQPTCSGRQTTLEITVPKGKRHDGHDFVLIKRSDLVRLRAISIGALDAIAAHQVIGWRGLCDAGADE